MQIDEEATLCLVCNFERPPVQAAQVSQIEGDIQWICCDNEACGAWLHQTCAPEKVTTENLDDPTFKFYCHNCKAKADHPMTLSQVI